MTVQACVQARSLHLLIVVTRQLDCPWRVFGFSAGINTVGPKSCSSPVSTLTPCLALSTSSFVAKRYDRCSTSSARTLACIGTLTANTESTALHQKRSDASMRDEHDVFIAPGPCNIFQPPPNSFGSYRRIIRGMRRKVPLLRTG